MTPAHVAGLGVLLGVLGLVAALQALRDAMIAREEAASYRDDLRAMLDRVQVQGHAGRSELAEQVRDLGARVAALEQTHGAEALAQMAESVVEARTMAEAAVFAAGDRATVDERIRELSRRVAGLAEISAD